MDESFVDFVSSLFSNMGELWGDLFHQFGPGIFIPTFIFLAVGIMAQWALYEKCGQPGYACVVPVWNVIVFLRIMGRPASHIWYFVAPLVLMIVGFMILGINTISFAIAGALGLFLFYFTVRVYIELCHCFGKTKWFDYVLVILLNGIYVLTLGLSYQAIYKGPVYKKR